MDLIKAQFARLQQQLSGLTASQRMLAATLVAIMGMTLFWWARYAGEAEMEPLLNQSFTPDDISQVTTHLASKDIKYRIAGDKVLIPADRKIEILADLGFARLLPKKMNTGFDDIVKQMTPWDPASKTDRMWTEAKQRTLAQVIENFPNVTHADVEIDPHEERRFDGKDVTPTAMVNVVTRDPEEGRKGVRQLAMAAADVVAGAEAGLSRGKVTVIVDGATIPVPDKNADGELPDGDTIIEAIRGHESYYREQIQQQLRFIHGLFVSVRVDLNTRKTETQDTVIDPKNTVHLTVSETDHTTETTGATPAAEPGAVPNVSNTALSVGGGTAPAGSGGTSTETQSSQTYQNEVGKKLEHVVQNPGDAPPVSASVRVPRSYFIAVFKDVNHGKEPDDASLEVLMKAEMAHIRDDVRGCTGIKADDAVTVNWYSDGGGPAPTPPVSQASAAPVSLLIGAHGKEVGVGALAVVSLFMVMMMVKKAAPAPLPAAPSAAADLGASQRLQGDSDVVGEVSESDPMLDGMELDDESAKTQQMVDQVSDLVSQNPDAAAALVKRWLNRA